MARGLKRKSSADEEWKPRSRPPPPKKKTKTNFKRTKPLKFIDVDSDEDFWFELDKLTEKVSTPPSPPKSSANHTSALELPEWQRQQQQMPNCRISLSRQTLDELLAKAAATASDRNANNHGNIEMNDTSDCTISSPPSTNPGALHHGKGPLENIVSIHCSSMILRFICTILCARFEFSFCIIFIPIFSSPFADKQSQQYKFTKLYDKLCRGYK